jgi:hypothetical protein
MLWSTSVSGVEVVTVQLGDPAYEELLGPVREDRALLAQMWADAESRLDEEPGKSWCIAMVEVDGRQVAAAWAAAVEVEHQSGVRMLRCCNNYERPGYRGRGLYALAYAHRHATVVRPSGMPAITWIFDQPRALHERDGWVVTDVGISREPDIEPHRWFEMRRTSTSG